MAVRINITLPEYVLDAADKRAAELGTTRSGFIATALQFKMQYDDMMQEVPRMLQVLQDVQAGKLGPDLMQEILRSTELTAG